MAGISRLNQKYRRHDEKIWAIKTYQQKVNETYFIALFSSGKEASYVS